VTAAREPIARPVARRVLDERTFARATFVVAPAGFGKSTLLREVAAQSRSVFTIVRDGATFARFTSDLVEATAKLVPGLDRSFAGAFSRAIQTGDPERTLALWFTRQLAGTACRFIVDGVDRANGHLVGAFLQHAIAASPSGVTWLVATRHLETLSPDTLLAFGHASLPLDKNDLRLQAGDLETLASNVGTTLDDDAARVVAAKAAGSISRAFLLLRAHAHGVAAATDPKIPFERVLADIFDGFSDTERTAALASSLSGASIVDAADPTLERLQAAAPFLFETQGARFQASFDAWLARTFLACDAATRDALRVAVAAKLEAAGDVRGSLALLASVADERLALACIERHASNALEREHLYFLHDAVMQLSEDARRTNPTVLAFLAMEASLGNQVDLAESLFVNALGALAGETSTARAHCIRYWYAVELVRRDRSDAIAVLRPDVAFFEATPRLRVAMMSTLGAAYGKAGRLDRAKRWLDRALRAVCRVDDEALRAYVHHQAAYVALCAENAAEARELAERAMRFADDAGAASIATAAASVLYAVAIDLDDDLPTAIYHLQRMSAYAARTANVSGQLYALAASFELETDRGNVAALAEIERELHEFDLQYGAAVESETIVPAQAIRHAWAGDFERAYLLLAGSDEQQFTDDRRALRLAEIATYAAAAGYAREAHDAAKTALALLRPAERDLRTLRARGFLALTLVLLGRTNEAKAVVRELEASAEPGSRNAAFARVVGALAERRDGARVSPKLRSALANLRRLDWTGIARIVESLPSHVVRPLAARPVVARTQLRSRVS
jgi:ATP/maltotriose-dependent transcriptional regulator MalT